MAPSNTRAHRLPGDPVTTAFLLGNLHCPSCVSAIDRVLHASCRDRIRWVSPNIVTSVVTVEHDPEASIETMAAELERAGFSVCGVTSTAGGDGDAVLFAGRLGHHDGAAAATATAAASSSPTSSLANALRGGGRAADGRHKGKQPATPSWLPIFGSRSAADSRDHKDAHKDAHLSNCEECRRNKSVVDLGVEPRPGSDARGPPEILDTSSAIRPRPTVPAETRGGTAASSSSAAAASESASAHIMSSNSLTAANPEHAPRWQVTVAIGGMTCAACTNTITKELNQKDWIASIAVNLITNSATFEIFDDKDADRVVEEIESLGYDAAIDTIVNIQEEALVERQTQTVEVSVDGMYCDHCPQRVVRSLEALAEGFSLNVEREPTRQLPILKLSYLPRAPDFTIRKILAAIEASDPALSVSIYHPPTLEERSKEIQRKHLQQILYRVIFTGIVCIPTFVLGIVYMTLLPDSNPDKHHLMMPWTSGINRLQIALFIMATPVYFFAADMFHVRAVKEIWTLWRPGSRTPVLQRFYRFGSMNTLMSLGTTIAYVSSTAELIAAAVHKPERINDASFYFDAVVFLTFFLLLGRLIESYTKSKTGDAVEALAKLRPTTAILVENFQDQDGQLRTEDLVVKTELLVFGDIVRIPHGTSPPADGVIVQGSSSFDESSLTGESRPIKKKIGDEVFAGTVNKDGPVLIRITGVSGHSMLDQIVRIVREGQTKRAPLEQFADILTTYFVPCITLIAIITWVVWMMLGLTGALPGHFLDVTTGGWVAFSLQFAIAVFVVACPCGLALAAPTAIFVGAGLAARYGILAKGGGLAFETASRIDCVVFDKTGTLTMGGEPRITDSKFFSESPEGSSNGGVDGTDDFKLPTTFLLAALKAVEENSSHTIAKAIVSFCAAHSLPSGHVDELQEIPGKGMRAVFAPTDGRSPFEIIVGNQVLMEEFLAIIPAGLDATLAEWTAGANSVALVAVRPRDTSDAAAADFNKGQPAVDGAATPIKTTPFNIRGALAISDPVRLESAAVIAALKRRGIRVYMLSGDNLATAQAVGQRLGIESDCVLAEVLPAEKADKIKYLQQTLKARSKGSESTMRRAMVAMVGDGVNDAPALTQADVGVAIGSGSDVAISSASFVLVNSDLRSVVTLLELSRAVFRRVRLNFGWALVYNVVAVPVAAGALFPLVGPNGEHVRLDPVWAALAMALSSISVVVSSLLLRSRLWGVGFRPGVVEVPREETDGDFREREDLTDDDASVVVSTVVGDDKI